MICFRMGVSPAISLIFGIVVPATNAREEASYLRQRDTGRFRSVSPEYRPLLAALTARASSIA